MTDNPVLKALERSRRDAQLKEWARNEATMRLALERRLGQPSLTEGDSGLSAALAIFRSWCERNGVRYCPAQPASLAQFVLDHTELGVEGLTDIVGNISESYATLGLANPAATWIVAAAMKSVGDVPPPRSWPKHLGTQFALLPLHLKKYVAAHDAQRERVLRRAQNDAAKAKRALLKTEQAVLQTDPANSGVNNDGPDDC